MERKRPAHDEVEIEVEAAGLNFRDLMWSLSLLPEDMLENGFSGATLGLECAGRVVRVGRLGRKSVWWMIVSWHLPAHLCDPCHGEGRAGSEAAGQDVV